MFEWLTKPLTKAPSRLAKKAADTIDNPLGEGGRLKGFLAGATEGAGDLISDMTSPLSIGMSALGAGGLKRLSSLKRLGRVKSADNVATEGIKRLGPEFTPVGSEAMENSIRAGRMAGEAKKVQQISKEAQARRMGIDPNDADDLIESMSSRPMSGRPQVDDALARFKNARQASKERFNTPRQY